MKTGPLSTVITLFKRNLFGTERISVAASYCPVLVTSFDPTSCITTHINEADGSVAIMGAKRYAIKNWREMNMDLQAPVICRYELT